MTAPERRAAPFYGRRRGRRLNQGRATLLDNVLPDVSLALPDSGPLDVSRLFADPISDLWLEIGFGSGEHLAEQAKRNPGVGFIGSDPFLNGVSSLLGLIQHENLRNIRLFPDDARPLLDALPPDSIGRCFILFADPWPKKRHHRRRFFGSENLDRLSRVLRRDAELRVATDHPEFAEWTLERLSVRQVFFLDAGGVCRERPLDWPPTRYEAKAIEAGRRPFYIVAHAR